MEWLREVLKDPTASLLLGIVGGIVFASVVGFLTTEASSRLAERRRQRHIAHERVRRDEEHVLRDTLAFVNDYFKDAAEQSKRALDDRKPYDYNKFPERSLRAVGDLESVEAWVEAIDRLRLWRDPIGLDHIAALRRAEHATDRVVDALVAQLQRSLGGHHIDWVTRADMVSWRHAREERDDERLRQLVEQREVAAQPEG